MKKILIGLMAIAITLGVSCKKDVVVQPESTKELVKPSKSAVVDAGAGTEHNTSCPAAQDPGSSKYGPCSGCPKSGG